MMSKERIFLGLLCAFPILLLLYAFLSSDHQTVIPPKFLSVLSRVGSSFSGVSTTTTTVDPLQSVTDEWKGTNRSVTIVTAFFDIGKFPKGSFSQMRSTNTYSNWLKIFGYLENNMVIYTDTKEMENVFRSVRANYSTKTKYIHISRDSLWPFQIIPRIKKLYSTPGYPKHYPNTYIPEYTSLTHSKMPILADAVKKKYFGTDYYCWFDIGYFRDIAGSKKKFWMEVPDDFDPSKIGVTRVYHVKLENIMPKTIIYQNRNWIGGGLFLGTPSTILKFAEQYKKATLRYLDQGLMNVEQHILYSMYTKEERKKYPLEVDVQLYIPGQKKVINSNPWFYLGFVMYHQVPQVPQ